MIRAKLTLKVDSIQRNNNENTSSDSNTYAYTDKITRYPNNSIMSLFDITKIRHVNGVCVMASDYTVKVNKVMNMSTSTRSVVTVTLVLTRVKLESSLRSW